MTEASMLTQPQPTYTASSNEVTPRRLYDSFGMNPRIVRFYLAEKGIDLPRQEVDILGAENRRTDHLERNPAGQLPTLELSDGTFIAETAAIIEYLEELHPQPPLVGSTPEERAITRMWWRRVEIGICRPMVLGFYYGEAIDIFESRFKCYPEQADAQKEIARTGTRWLDGAMNKPWLAGDRFTAADICLYCYIDQLCDVGQPIAPDLRNVNDWFDRVGKRSAAKRSIWRDRPMGMRG
ncbi:MAG TPA: glutathione S-transferase family protein [Sphingomicrobium sp.]|nr:glutathione S-transferase family protein [Sphingomicrobium sp.]